MKARLFTLFLLLTIHSTIVNAQFWKSLTDKKGAWGINKIPGQNTTAPMVLFNIPLEVQILHD